MKKLLSTIGLGVALMTGFAPSQADAAISFVNTQIGPNEWKYTFTTDAGVTAGQTVTLTSPSGVTITDASAASTGWWDISGKGTNSITWTSKGAISGGTVADDFTITSAFPNGIVTWSTTGGSGTTAGPVPEPATVMLLGIGGLLAGGRKLYESRKEAATA